MVGRRAFGACAQEALPFVGIGLRFSSLIDATLDRVRRAVMPVTVLPWVRVIVVGARPVRD
jgi:hypothetical protein